MSDFYPMRGKSAIQRWTPEGETESGIIFTAKEHPWFAKGKVLSRGLPEYLSSGKEMNHTHKEGDYVLYNRQNIENFMGIDLVKHEDIIAIVDENTKIS